MSIRLLGFNNCDDVFLAWKPQAEIPNCLGFAIERKRNGKAEVLQNRVGFSDGPVPPSAPSTQFPFQRLTWTDHGADTGDTVSYRVIARVGTPDNLTDGPTSEWTAPIKLSAQCGDDVFAYFNRGVVLSQFIGRMMKENGWNAADIKTHIKNIEDKVRIFLAGELRKGLLLLLDQAIKDASLTLHAALFELNDPELLGKLVQVGKRLNIVLANGAIKTKGDDENADARATLQRAGANVIDRMSAPTFLGHNKFLVISRKDVPQSVWTGSANWQPTGLCTQANNGILIHNASLAQTYREAWERLRAAGDAKTAELRAGNAVSPPKVHALKNNAYAYAQFTSVPTRKTQSVDIAGLLDLISGAKESLLFAMFMPGADIFNAALARGDEIFVRGVANTFPKAALDTVDVGLVNNGQKAPNFNLKVVEPQGIAEGFSAWVDEVTRSEFNAIGHAIIHSKVLVIDAFGPNPTIVTGSHNFSKTASQSNDENFVVISGNAALAQAYAVNVLGLYDHYRWRKHNLDNAKQGRKTWSHLSSDPHWLKQYKSDEDRKALLQALGL
ncbi:hypothetical protein KIK84_14705 [Curvibacter sp. CHRR-16]|uniref:phospholipase D-like domain-containing protein n=1 Tax=Curvibacter sp. CHRR-16 TaxID=2835872 RepID=UPI001BDA75CF|nr:phospholipase D-like domain-containing protein [Curvibacter sp. CHRR-16]MBT0571575.1 hypothetical protein [Curvibacter sp. CHRR-16]